MPGIIVGIDGSDHSRQALEWAVNEAAARHAPLTVLTVSQAMASYWGGPVAYPEDPELTEQALKEAQQETDNVLDEFDEGSGRRRSRSARSPACPPRNCCTPPRTRT